MEVGIQGIGGSFHHQAATSYFGEQRFELKPHEDFRSLAKSIQSKDLDYGIMAIENTIAGSILPNYALINEYNLKITGEVYARIELSLIGHKGTRVEDLEQVYSHPMALLQSADYLGNYPQIKHIEFDDTADSVRLVKEKEMKKAAAIASSRAAEIFDLEVLQENIETNKANYTRFLILSGRKNGQGKLKQKASLRLVTKHDPGSLCDVLQIFKHNEINLTKIQSMPILGHPYQYAFHIDVVWNDYVEYQRALQEVKDHSLDLKIFGEYEKGKFPQL